MAILSTLLVSGVSRAADGMVTMNWNSCTGPIDIATENPAITNLYISVSGMDVPHKAYDVRFIYGNASQAVPDAWRFDATGCEGPTLIAQNTTSKSCVGFMQSASGLQIKKVQFSPPSDPYATTLMQVLLANSYNAGVAVVDPNVRYLLEQVVFDLSAAVDGAGSPPATCGGFEQPMCFKLSWATYLDMASNEIPFGRAPVTSVSYLGASACGSIPAKPTTWGNIKGQYRN
jgi:hypothetical protein